MLSQAAFNAFLKTLEEPPSYAIFILATTEKHKILPTILSRCQIFDFNRILTRDIADHLHHIAEKEGIKTEREALELIGQKADGGLRDALSMFDLNVTFSTDNFLGYKEVLENLHILDYDYYFKLTDAMMGGSITQSLLIYDEIIRKGFDGHLFIVGLLEHFRNLLVCKDPATISLLEVSETAQQKYLSQSAQASISFLLSSLSIGSQCDINYKAAKNQRLHVELCLMKLANLPGILNLQDITAVDDTAKKKVDGGVSAPPVSSYSGHAAAQHQPGTATFIGSTTAITPPPISSKLRSTKAIGSVVTTSSTTVQPEKSSIKEEKNELHPGEIEQLSFETLSIAWNEFAAKRHQLYDISAEAVVLSRDFELVDTTIRIALDNDMLEETLTSMKGELVRFLRTRFNEPNLTIESRVAPAEVKRQPYTAQEKFNYLAEKNPILIELQQALGLDTDF